MNQYPAKPLMDQMAKHGRYGDTMLVHMNPIEVAGIASLSPTGKLTTNPVTGQPEAFLPLLAPALGILGGALKLGTLGTAALTGIGTAAVTGDLKRGLLAGLSSGIMSGVGEGIGEALRGGADAVTQGTIDTAGTALAGGAEAAEGIASAIQPDLMQTPEGILKAAEMGLPGAPGTALTSPQMSLAGADASGLAPTPEPSGISALSSGVDQLVGGLSPMQATMLAGIPAGQMAQMDVQDEMAANARRLEEESYASEMEAYGDLQSAYGAAQPGVGTGVSPYRSMMSQRTQQPYMPTIGFAEGGSTDPLVVEPSEEEARVLAMAGRDTPLSPEDQRILESYYARRNAQLVRQEAEESGIADGVLKIPAGTTNQEALDILRQYGLISTDDYGWFTSHLRATGNADSKYLAGQNFPGVDKYLEQNQFGEDEAARVRRIVGVLDQATGEGIKEEDLNYLTEGAITGFGMYGGYGAGYGGIDPVSIQAGLRPDYSVAPPLDYMTGFEPEFSYFQDDPTNVRIPTRAFRPTTAGITSEGEYFDPILDREQYLQQIRDYYTMLASYSPSQPVTPEEPPSEPDDEDVIGEPVGEEPTPEPTPEPAPPAYGPYADRYDAWRRNADFILDKVRRGAKLSPSEEQWYKKYEAGLIVDPRYRPEGFTVPASYEEAMALFESGGYEGIQTVEFGSLEDVDRGDEEQYPVGGAKQGESQKAADSGASTGGLGDLRPTNKMLGIDNSPWLRILEAIRSGEIELGNQDELGFGHEQKGDDTVTPEEEEAVRETGNRAGTRAGQLLGTLNRAEGGEIPLRTPMGEVSVPSGGIANMPTEFNANMPSKEEFNMVASAVLGEMANSDEVIEMFVRKYGPEMFMQIRDMILNSIVPNAQTEGMIRGEGGGMDDMVGGMIGNQQPVAVSPGEYIVPADVVSGLGDGSSDAGAEELDQMMSRVRMARGGTTEQAPPIDAKKVMPA